MKKNDIGIPIVTRKELNLILDRIKVKANAKGILIMGKPGTGKTTIAKQYWPDMVSSNQLATHYMLKGIEGFVNAQGQLMYPTHAIDDLGTEVLPSHYGNRLDLVTYLIQTAYEQSRAFKMYTTNLNYTELVDRYGDRVVDRLKEKCYFFILEDTTFRTITQAEQINEDLQ